MARSKSSSAWLKRHVNDPYVHRARAHGYRSRAAYKLIEIAEREGFARPGDAVVDLGAAPGGWAQALAERVGRSGRVVAVDLQLGGGQGAPSGQAAACHCRPANLGKEGSNGAPELSERARLG